MSRHPSEALPRAVRALLIIDMQQGLFHAVPAPHESARVLANIQSLIAKARAVGAPIFVVRHTGPAGSPIAPGSALTQVIAELDVDAQRDVIFDKTRQNAFVGTALEAQLREAGVSELVIVGMKTEMCVDSTSRAAADLGLRPVLVSDAHTTFDSPALPAASIVAHHNHTLAAGFARVCDTQGCDF